MGNDKNKVTPVIPTLFLTKPETEIKTDGEETTTETTAPVPIILQEDQPKQQDDERNQEIEYMSPNSRESLSIITEGSNVSEVSPEEFYHQENRSKWLNPKDSLIICIVYCIGSSNFETFPKNCIEHGGTAYVIAYTIILIVFAIPIAYLEMALGQFVQQGCLGVWKLVPLLRGVAYIVTFVNVGFTLSFSIYCSWILSFLSSAFVESSKWAICENEWNTKDCVDFSEPETIQDSFVRIKNGTGRFVMEEFYRGHILKEEFLGINRTKYDLGYWGPVDSLLSGFLVITYLAVLFALGFSNRYMGKIAYFTFGIPVFILTLILFRSFTIPGAYLGVEYFFETSSIPFNEFKLWKDATLQAIFSTGIGTAGYITIGSYNKFKHPILGDIIRAFFIDELISILATIAYYALMGAMALRVHHPVQEVTSIGVTQLAFQTFPDIISRVPGAKHFLILFYIMMVLNVWDTFAVLVEVLITCLIDANEKFFRVHKYARLTILFILVSLGCIVNFIALTPGGVYLVAIFDAGFSSITQAVCNLFFVVSFVAIFGIEGIIHAIKWMNPNCSRWILIFFEICWAIVIPTCLGYIALVEWFHETAPEWFGVPVPEAAKWVSTTIKFGPVILIPVFATYVLIRTEGPNLRMKFLLTISPLHEHDEIRRTGKCVRSRCIQCCFIAHWYRQTLDAVFEHRVKLAEEEVAAEDEENPGGLVALESAKYSIIQQSIQINLPGMKGSMARPSSGSQRFLTSSTSLALPVRQHGGVRKKRVSKRNRNEDEDDD